MERLSLETSSEDSSDSLGPRTLPQFLSPPQFVVGAERWAAHAFQLLQAESPRDLEQRRAELDELVVICDELLNFNYFVELVSQSESSEPSTQIFDTAVRAARHSRRRHLLAEGLRPREQQLPHEQQLEHLPPAPP